MAGYIILDFQCPDCGFEMKDQMLERPPEGEALQSPECPQCLASLGEPVPSTTAIGERKASRSVDGMYKQMEEGAATRAEALGDPSLKMTDMKDGFYGGGLRPGDTTAPSLPKNPITDYAQATGFNFWGQGPQGPGGGTTLEATLTKAQAGRSKDAAPGIAALNQIQGGSGPMQFPARARPTA